MQNEITTWREYVKVTRRMSGNDLFQRRVDLAPVHYKINERTTISKTLDGIENVGLVTFGTDCDGGSFSHFHAINVSGLMDAQKKLDEAYSWLDGPGSVKFVDAETRRN